MKGLPSSMALFWSSIPLHDSLPTIADLAELRSATY
jgi:hypothetical protein